MDIPEAVVRAIDAIRIQIDIIAAFSSGGIGIIILSWARILGILKDADFSSFRYPSFLIFPVMLFILSVICGYLVGSQISGYYLELANGITSKGSVIRNASKHFFCDYNEPFHWFMLIQLISNVLGILTLSAWFAWNIYRKTRSA